MLSVDALSADALGGGAKCRPSTLSPPSVTFRPWNKLIVGGLFSAGSRGRKRKKGGRPKWGDAFFSNTQLGPPESMNKSFWKGKDVAYWLTTVLARKNPGTHPMCRIHFSLDASTVT